MKAGRAGAERLGPYIYRWTEDCFPLGADSLALGEFCTLKEGDNVLDLGCGAGLLLFLCARRCGRLTLTGVEKDPKSGLKFLQNMAENGVNWAYFQQDLREFQPANLADLVLSNPPWYPDGSGKAGGAGRMEDGCTLPELCKAAARCMTPKGRFAVVHRPERLGELFEALKGAGLEPKRMQLCRHSPDKRPYAVLVEATKGRPGLEILPDRL